MDSNHRPTDYESAALTAVLRAPVYRSNGICDFPSVLETNVSRVSHVNCVNLRCVLIVTDSVGGRLTLEMRRADRWR